MILADMSTRPIFIPIGYLDGIKIPGLISACHTTQCSGAKYIEIVTNKPLNAIRNGYQPKLIWRGLLQLADPDYQSSICCRVKLHPLDYEVRGNPERWLYMYTFEILKRSEYVRTPTPKTAAASKRRNTPQPKVRKTRPKL